MNQSDVKVLVERQVAFNACGRGACCGSECLLLKPLPIDYGGSQSSTSSCVLIRGAQWRSLNCLAATSSRATRQLDKCHCGNLETASDYAQHTADGISSDPDYLEMSNVQGWTRPCGWGWKQSHFFSVARESSAGDGAKLAKANDVNCHVNPTG